MNSFKYNNTVSPVAAPSSSRRLTTEERNALILHIQQLEQEHQERQRCLQLEQDRLVAENELLIQQANTIRQDIANEKASTSNNNLTSNIQNNKTRTFHNNDISTISSLDSIISSVAEPVSDTDPIIETHHDSQPILISPFDDEILVPDDASVGSAFTEASFHTFQSTTSSLLTPSSNPQTQVPEHRNCDKKKKKKTKKKKKKLNTTINTSPTLQSEEYNGVLPHKKDHVIRFLLQNPNGITGGTKHGKLLQIISAIKHHQIDFTALPESHINPHGDTRKRIDAIYNQLVQDALITHTNTPLDEANNGSMQYGGVTSMLSPKLCKKYELTNHDPLGRWHSHSFFTAKGKLRVYTLYKVNKGSTKNELSAWSAQAWNIIKKNLNITPEKLVVDDLVEVLQEDIAKEIDIIVMADANEHHKSSNPYLLQRLSEIGLLNVMEQQFGVNLPPTHTRGSAAIDHIWTSPRVHNAIIQAGILPINIIFDSDHRALYMDIDLRAIFREDDELISTYDRRRLKSNNIKRKIKYISFAEYQMDQQNVHNRITKLKKLIDQNAPREEIAALIESIDHQIHEILLSAEKQLPHIHTMQWTPEVTDKLIYLYKLNNKRKHLIKISKQDNVNMQDEISAIDEEKLTLKEWFANRTLTSEKIREEFLDALADDYQKSGKFKKKEHAVKVLKNIEKQKRNAVQLGSVLKPFEKSGLPYVLVPDPCEYDNIEGFENTNFMDPDTIWRRIEIDQGKDIKEWRPIVLQADMEELLLRWQELHFRQANTTTFGKPEWIEKLEQQIDESTPTLDCDNESELSNNEKAFLDNLLQNPTNIAKYKMSLQDFLAFIDSKDERTVASPSGRHYGHFKSLRHSYILDYIYEIIQASVAITYIPTRLSRTLTTLAPKDDEPKIHRLRPLHIIEPEIQFISHHFWAKTFMQESEKHNLLTDSQYGGRRGRQAQHGIIKQVLIWDIVKLQNKYLASHLADARANFDRNMAHVVGLALKSRNFDPHLIKFYQKFLKSQVFNLRTSFGTTAGSYTYDPNNPHFGDGQGIGWSSVNQILISTVIDQVYNAIAPMFQLSSIDEFFQIMTGVNFFIDDRISNTVKHDNDLKQLMKDFQANESLQAELLNASGGAIAPKKCAWWLLARDQGSLKYTLRQRNLDQCKLFLKNIGDSHAYEIERMPPSQAVKYLGALVSPLMSNKAQIKKMRVIIKDWSNKILHSRLRPSQVIQAYKEYLVPKLAYPLVICDLSYEECDELMGLIRKTIAKKTSYHSSTRTSVTHGPSDFLGDELPHLFDIAGNEKLSFLFQHIRNCANKKDTVADAIHTSILDHMLHLGTFNNFFNLDFDKWSKLIPSKTWLTSIWRYLHYYQNELDFDNLPTYNLPYENDFFIMDEILQHETDENNLLKFNRVRLQYKLLTASDIVLANGFSLHPDLRNTTNSFVSRNSTFNWPNPEKLPSTWYTLFRSMLRDYVVPRIKSTPIGARLNNSNQHQFKVAQLISNDRISFLGSQFIRTTGNNFVLDSTPPQLFASGIYVDVYRTGVDRIREAPIFNERNLVELDDISDNIFEDAPDWMKDAWGIEDTTPTRIDTIRNKLQEPMFIVSDGGVPDGKTFGVYAWALADINGNIFYHNGGAIGGLRGDQDSFRAEAYGALGAVTFLNFLESNGYDISSDRKYYSDNMQVTKLRATSYINPKKSAATKKHFDVKTQLQNALQSSTLSTKPFFNHVKGHQDRVKAFHECLPQEKVNILVDAHCHTITKFIQEHPEEAPSDITPFLPAQQISIRNKLHRLVLSSFNESQKDLRRAELLTSIYDKLNLAPSTYHGIDWDALQLFGKTKYTTSHRKFLKILHRKWLTMREKKKMNPEHDGLCPLCGKEEETFHHILSCSSEYAVQARATATRTLRQSLRLAKTPIFMIDSISHILQNNESTNDLISTIATTNKSYKDEILRAFTNQQQLGWDLAVSGLIVKDWAPLIKRYYKDLGLLRSPSIWCRDFIKILMTWAHDIWRARCDFIHQNNKNHLADLRTELFDKCNYYNDPANRHEVGRYTYLLKRSRSFFMYSTETNLLVWKQRLSYALKDTLKEARQQPRIDSIFTLLHTTSHHRKTTRTRKSSTPPPIPKRTLSKKQQLERAATMHRSIDSIFRPLPQAATPPRRPVKERQTKVKKKLSKKQKLQRAAQMHSSIASFLVVKRSHDARTAQYVLSDRPDPEPPDPGG